jgi:hypothetical protein
MANHSTTTLPQLQTSSKLNRSHTDVLVVHCSDHRFQAGFYEFLNLHLGLNENYDLLSIPGGPQALTLVEYLPKLSWALTRWVRFLIDSHELKRMILITHQDCGWYKSLPFHLFGGTDPRRRQEDDLRRVQRAMAKEFPHLRVELYFAGWDSADHVTIEQVSG